MINMEIELTRKEADLIESVLGQMSDGKWENNRSYEKYWTNISVEKDNVLSLDLTSINYRCGRNEVKSFEKNFKDEDAIKKWFAHKAQLVHNDDCKTHFYTNSFKGHENETAHFLNSWRNKDINQTYEEIQETINLLANKTSNPTKSVEQPIKHNRSKFDINKFRRKEM